MWSTQMRRYTRMKSYRRWMSSEAGKRYAAVWGNGDFGRLGTGSLDSQWRPKLLLSSCFANHSLKSIACGGAHTLFLTETGCVYATGLNDFGQLGISGNLSYTTEPVKVSGLQKEIMQISAGYHHSCAITVDGELYMWGRNSNGQLGLGKKAQRIVPLPTKVEYLNGLTIKLVALGSEHSIAVTDRGEALSWGLGGFGRLGHSNQSGTFRFWTSTSEYTPRSIKKLEEVKVKSVAAGLLHSACIDVNGSVFVFGEVSVDRTGFGEAIGAEIPSMVGKLPCANEVSCGGYHTCVVTSGGELYAWGVNENGCLGIGSFNSLHAPERVQGPFLRSPVEKVSCGWRHTAAISGNIYTWGWGGSNGTFSEDGHSSGGQLGHGSDVDYLNPKSIIFENNVKVLQVSCGFNHTGAILENAKS
ncbi:ultraviolet-B receptor UVR8 isoform X2 [Ricinus communis]|uniref:ultraviolet-B receptor UVR8 isoform X2 n=1 Tax=Ricinus communis TaxID=3988 RepID=UPI000D68FC8C|nr:ultraviolet-B receptor UVR8 isoform X2 [Ricinus communis]|eukprot:XP_025012510.1 ultraviolet-B receptor UVR8 isoform X2 [Ricinus communis]